MHDCTNIKTPLPTRQTERKTETDTKWITICISFAITVSSINVMGGSLMLTAEHQLQLCCFTECFACHCTHTHTHTHTHIHIHTHTHTHTHCAIRCIIMVMYYHINSEAFWIFSNTSNRPMSWTGINGEHCPGPWKSKGTFSISNCPVTLAMA